MFGFDFRQGQGVKTGQRPLLHENRLTTLEQRGTSNLNPESQPSPEPDRLAVAADEAIAACGGDARDAVRALIVANEFLEALVVEELRADVSKGYARGYHHGRFKTYTG